MKVLGILLCVGFALSYPGYNPYDEDSDCKGDSDEGQEEHSHTDFLSGLPEKALSEYYKIVQKTSQTVLEQEKSLQRWAQKYGVEDKYRAHMEEHEKQHKAFEQDVNHLLKKLASYFKAYFKLSKEKRISLDRVIRESEKLYKMLDENQQAIAWSILEKYQLTMDGNSGNHGGSSGNNGGFPKNNGGYAGAYNGDGSSFAWN